MTNSKNPNFSFTYKGIKFIGITIFLLIKLPVRSQSNYTEFNTYKNSQIGIEFKYPKDWELGNSSISNIYWVGIPNYQSEGNVTLKVIPWMYKVDVKNYRKDQYKKDILSSSVYYKDLEFIEFNNQIIISGIDGIYSYYKGVGKYVKSNYYEVTIQFVKNNLLFTLQGQFRESPLRKDQIEDFKYIINNIKLY